MVTLIIVVITISQTTTMENMMSVTIVIVSTWSHSQWAAMVPILLRLTRATKITTIANIATRAMHSSINITNSSNMTYPRTVTINTISSANRIMWRQWKVSQPMMMKKMMTKRRSMTSIAMFIIKQYQLRERCQVIAISIR